ncbi:MAG: hypothetical protein QGG09_19600 [Pirellulaceae bacterium]|nr:hypothetical protein [Pirellulaceae bacterium]HJN08885.1 hypothetical protein [Pirellulaceae bacterium]
MTTRPKRRFLRFSLRAMLVVLTVFSVWLGVQVNRARNQRAAVNWVTKNGGEVEYDWTFNSKLEPPGPRWLRQKIGDEYFQSVVQVLVGRSEVHDLSPLVKLPALKQLAIINTPVSDEEVSNLQEALPNCRITR